MPGPLIPIPTYRDIRKAIDFLVDAFGFERHAVYEDEDGSIAHVELAFGDSMLMLAAPGEGAYGSLVAAVPAGGQPTGGMYVLIDDVRTHCERARAGGAEILIEPRDRDYGGSDYTCRDPEGHVWTFGSYDPWESGDAGSDSAASQ